MDNALWMASGLAVVGVIFALVVRALAERQERHSKHR